jgi:hypothetical protein
MRNLWQLLGLFAISLLSSCLDGREEYWINRDGSGRLEARYMLPSVAVANMGGEAAMRSKIEAFFANQKNVNVQHLAIKNESGSVFLEINVAFSRASDFVALLNGGKDDTTKKKPDALDLLLGTMKAQRDGLNVALQRDVDMRELFAESPFPLQDQHTRNRDLEYIIHLPVKVQKSNAHEVTDDGKTLRWSFPLALALKEPLHVELYAPIPFPYWFYALLIAFSLCVIFWIWKKCRKPSKKRSSREVSPESAA